MIKTKKAVVRELYDQGITKPKEIALKTGFSYELVAVYIYQIRHPEKFKQDHAKCVKNWASKNPEKRKKIRKKWRANNPEKDSELKMRQYHNHQKATKVSAQKHNQEWLLQDIEYLKIHAHEQSAHQIAIHLGRTYKSVMSAAQRFGITMHDNEGKNGSNFVGAYDNVPISDQSIQEA